MTRNQAGIFLLAIVFSINLFSQQSATYTNPLTDFQKALSLYNNQQYLAAQAVFNKVKKNTLQDNIKSDCAYYIANCAVRLCIFFKES